MPVHVASVILGGLLLGLISFFVVSRNMAFAATGVAHAMFGGIAFAVVLGFDPTVGGMLFGLLMGLGIYLFGGKLPRDAVIGVLFSFLMSVGAIALRFYRGYANLLWSYMFGNITTATWGNVLSIAVVLIVGLTLMFWKYEGLKLYLFSEEIAMAEKVPVNVYHGVLLLFETLTIVLVLRVFGSILASSLVVVPAMVSFALFRGFLRSFLMSGLVSVLLSIAGYVLAFYLDLPYGATTTSLAFVLFAAVWGLGRGVIWLRV